MSKNTISDSEILRLFANAQTQERAFKALVEAYQSRLYWHIRQMVFDHDDTNDLLQTTFIKAWQALPKFRQDAQLFTWLYRIATNNCISFLNNKRRRFFVPMHDIGPELAQKAALGLSPTADEITKKLHKAVALLPDKQRLVFTMKYFQDLDYETISAIVGTSVGALKASYHHAVKKIEQSVLNH